MKTIPPCPTCGGTDYAPWPDSLAVFCKECGYTWVEDSGEPLGWTRGASVKEWADDVFGKKPR